VDGEVGADTPAEDQDQGRTHPEEDVAEVASLADLVQVGQQDGHDHAGLHALAQEDDEGRDHARPSGREGDTS